jgi:hypothetical protein
VCPFFDDEGPGQGFEMSLFSFVPGLTDLCVFRVMGLKSANIFGRLRHLVLWIRRTQIHVEVRS